MGDGWGPGGCSLTESAAQAWVSFALFAFRLPVCDRTLRPFPVGGPFPCQQRYSFNPARPSTARLAGEMPPLREGDRYFLAAPAGTATTLPCHLPGSKNQAGSRIQFKKQEPGIQSCSISRLFLFRSTRLIYKTAHSDIHHHPQRQEHKQHGRPAVTH